MCQAPMTLKRQAAQTNERDNAKRLRPETPKEKPFNVAFALEQVTIASAQPSKVALSLEVLVQLARSHLLPGTLLAFLQATRSVYHNMFKLPTSTAVLQNNISTASALVECLDSTSHVLEDAFEESSGDESISPEVLEVSKYQIATWTLVGRLYKAFTAPNHKTTPRAHLSALNSMHHSLLLALKKNSQCKFTRFEVRDRISLLISCMGVGIRLNNSREAIAITRLIFHMLDQNRSSLTEPQRLELRQWYTQFRGIAKGNMPSTPKSQPSSPQLQSPAAS